MRPPAPHPGMAGHAYTCPACHATSWNPADAPAGYSAACHAFTGEGLTPGQALALEVARAVDLELAGLHAALAELAHRQTSAEGRLERVETADQLIADHLGPGTAAEAYKGLEGLQ